MTVKDKVLAWLEKNRGNYCSGEEIAEKLGVTRASVWKAVRSLREDHFSIEAVSGKGYRLTDKNDILTVAGTGTFLKYADPKLITVYREIDSTNTKLSRMALEGAPHGTVVIALQQTAGRGRLGRTFVSPPDSGIYLSILVRPETDLAGAVPITSAAAVAVCEAVRQLTGKNAGIKWVNDIYIGSKKYAES